MKHAHRMPFGAHPGTGQHTDFALWAPAAKHVQLLLNDRPRPCKSTQDGWWRVQLAAPAGTRYQWVIDEELRVPDPASRFNPEGPHAASQVVDPLAFEWRANWKGRPWLETVAYQMHVGTFTPEGTFAAAAARLAALAELGITAVQLMPVAAAAGDFGWGYDSVLLYAPHPAYGTPEDLKHFVDTAHLHGVMVFLDVVYNHFGPDGNFLPRYAPQFDSPIHETPWGKSVNFDADGSRLVREFMIQNALYWLEEFQFDGLRLDAVHAMVDDSGTHIVEELTRRAHAAHPDRFVHIVLENDDNNPSRLGLPTDLCEGQWNGDFHHCLHVLMTGESKSYYGEYIDDPVGKLARVLTLGFAREGNETPRPHQPPRRDATSTISLLNSVNFLQCHDQIGNRAFGDRLAALSSPESVRLASSLLLLSPPIPMLFMGEEQDSRKPFLYFSDVKAELRDAVRAGRREEFRDAPDGAWKDRGDPPDPCSRETFEMSVIEQPEELSEPQRLTVAWTRLLLGVRREHLTPLSSGLQVGTHESRRFGSTGLCVRWHFDEGRTLRVFLNLGDEPARLDNGDAAAATPDAAFFVVGSVEGDTLGPWSGIWIRDDARE